MFTPETLNEETREVEVCFGSDTPVRSYNWDIGCFWEVLSFENGHVRTNRLENGAPLLDNHNRWGSVTDSVLGVVVEGTYRSEGRKGYCKVRFSKSEIGEKAFMDVKDGILRNISVGYKVYTYEQRTASKPGEMDTYTAIDWEPNEISLTPVPADPAAGVRSARDEADSVEVSIITHQTIRTMEPDQNPQVPNPANPAPVVPAVDANAVRTEAVAAERKRVSEIHAAVRTAKLPDEFAVQLVTNGTEIDQARALIIEEWAKGGPEAQRSQNPEASRVNADREREGRIRGVQSALILRGEPSLATDNVVSAEDRQLATQFRSMSLLDIAKDCLERAGVSTRGMDKMELVARAITSSTSDFPLLLEGTNRRVLLAAYQSIPDTWRNFCRVGSVGDFREYKRLRSGSIGNLQLVRENGEYKTASLFDAEQEKIAAQTKGLMINISRQMIINDDLSAFTSLAANLGRSSARTIEVDVFSLFALGSGNGPTMGDGNPLFHSSHSNIAATAAAPSVVSFDAARVQMATQKEPGGNDFINVRPSVWLGPIGLGGNVRVLNGAQYDPDVTSKFQVPNKVVGLFNSIIDTPRLSGTPWYAIADPMEEAVFEVVFLDGNQTPYLEQDQPFNVDGLQWKIRLDYGVGCIGWRGIVKNAGA